MGKFDSNSRKFSGDDSEKMCLIYDRECPVCRYVAEKYETENRDVNIVNARDDDEYLDRVTQMGLDINSGIVVIEGGEYYFAGKAVQRLATTKALPGLMGSIVGRAFRNSLFVKFLYPPLTLFRKILLRIIGVSLIRQHGLNEKCHGEKGSEKMEVCNREKSDGRIR